PIDALGETDEVQVEAADDARTLRVGFVQVAEVQSSSWTDEIRKGRIYKLLSRFVRHNIRCVHFHKRDRCDAFGEAVDIHRHRDRRADTHACGRDDPGRREVADYDIRYFEQSRCR